MKLLLTIMLLFMSITFQQVHALTPPANIRTGIAATQANNPFSINPQDWERITGKRLPFFKRLEVKLLQKYLQRKGRPSELDPEKQQRQAKWSFILGLASLGLLALLIASGGLVAGIIGLLSVPAAITAIILGIRSVRDNSNSKSIIGIVTGSLTLILFVLFLIVVATFLSIQ